jgi:hypothetical protein
MSDDKFLCYCIKPSGTFEVYLNSEGEVILEKCEVTSNIRNFQMNIGAYTKH